MHPGDIIQSNTDPRDHPHARPDGGRASPGSAAVASIAEVTAPYLQAAYDRMLLPVEVLYFDGMTVDDPGLFMVEHMNPDYGDATVWVTPADATRAYFALCDSLFPAPSHDASPGPRHSAVGAT